MNKKSIMEEIIGIIFAGIVILFVSAVLFGIAYIAVDSYFMFLKLEKHPKLLTIIDEVAHDICEEEGIKVFNKSYAEVNKNTTKGNEAVGMYIYTLDTEYQQRMNRTLKEVEELELKYGMSYERLCKIAGNDSTTTKEDFILPKILLCKDSLLRFGWGSYYSTFFHELGHHFAAKELGKHTEEDADRYAYRLMKERLPKYFLLFYDFHFEYRLKISMKRKDRISGYLTYLQYLTEKKYNDFKLKFA